MKQKTKWKKTPHAGVFERQRTDSAPDRIYLDAGGFYTLRMPGRAENGCCHVSVHKTLAEAKRRADL